MRSGSGRTYRDGSLCASEQHSSPSQEAFIILFLNTRAGSRDKKGAGVVKSVAEELRLFLLNASYPSECRGLSSDHGDFQQQSSKRKWTEKGFSSQQ